MPVFKLEEATVIGRTVCHAQQCPGTKLPSRIVGQANEADIEIGGVTCRALLDTGATVSTVSHPFYLEHLKQHTLHPIEDILKIECAGGQYLPYLGYIEADISIADIGGREQSAIFLVTPETDYQSHVPALLGTNTLRPIMQSCEVDQGQHFMKSVAQSTPWWLTFRSMNVEDRAVNRAKGCLGLVKCADSDTIKIPSNGAMTVRGLITDAMHCNRLAMLHPTEKTVLPAGVEIIPTLVNYQGGIGTVLVEISNPTPIPVIIQSRSVLCEMQQVDIEDQPTDEVTEMPRETESEQPSTESEEFLKLCNINPDLTPEQMAKVKELLLKYRDVFSLGEFDIGHTATLRHRIDLEDTTPFKQRHRRIPPGMYEEVKAHLRQLYDFGIIKESNSPWASGVVLVRKKDGGLRFCVDYRQLNQVTVKDAYALPQIDELLDNMLGATYFTSLDMRSGYHQVEIEEEHKARTAFTVGPLGFFEFERMPFGLTNAPATFQRLMERVMGNLHMSECCTFIDDVIIPGTDFDQEMTRLEHVLQKLREHHLKLNPKKCVFLQRKVTYCGHVVSENGVEADPEKTARIAEWPTPHNVADVRQFLGFAGYYRRFVKGFSAIAKPLTQLTGGSGGRGRRGKKKTDAEPVPWTWGPEQETAFNRLKQCLTTPPVLAYADYSLPFLLYTDASGDGLGAVLYQKQKDGQERVIAYASRGLRHAEKHYPAHKWEFLALKWAVTEKFHDYLYGNRFTAVTDNNPLTYILTTAKLDAAGHRWLAALASYDFDIRYRPGIHNIDADLLSRLPRKLRAETTQDEEKKPEPGEDGEYREISRDAIAALGKATFPAPVAEMLCLSEQVLESHDCGGAISMDPRDMRLAQRQDRVIGMLLPYTTRKVRPTTDQLPNCLEARQYIREFNRLTMQRGVLYRVIQLDGEDKLQLVLPQEYRKMALRGLHDDVGHLGRDKTLELVRHRFYWPGMSKDVEEWVSNCDRCIRRKTPANQRAPLVGITTTQPLELVCLDYLSLEASKGGFENILVITDHFTRYAQAIPTRNQTAKTTAEAFVNHYVVHYGLPRRIHSDQGANFMSRMMREMCDILGIAKSHTTPYHPIGNGMTERFNRTLLSMLGTLEPPKKMDWKAHVAPLVHAYNATRHESTGYSPFMLMFGREARLPIDLILSSQGEEPAKSYTKFAESLRNRLRDSYKLATAEADKARQLQKKNYDLRVRGTTIEVGDRVLVKILAHTGKDKLSDKWEQCPYTVLEQPNTDLPVYVVQREDGVGPKKTLHRNNLLLISSLPIRDGA